MSAPPSMLDPGLLPTYLAVFDTRRISAAAKALHLSQPAVTAQIHKLEDALGVALFVRTPRGVTPTPSGERLATYARSMESLLADACSAVGAHDEAPGDLLLAASTTLAAHVLPPLLAAYRSRYPCGALRLDVGNTEDVLAAVAGGRAPLGLVEGHGRAAGVRLEPFVDDELVAISEPGARARIRSLADLGAETILWREPGSGTRAVLERALRQANVRRGPGKNDVELGSSEAIVGAVAAGMGVAFVSRWSLQVPLAAGRVVLVPALNFSVRRVFRWARPAGGLRGAAARFYELAQRNPPVRRA